MDAKLLNQLLVIFVIIGLFCLLLYTLFFKPPVLEVLDLDDSYLEQVVSVSGTVKNLKEINNNLFFNLCNYSACVKVVYFNFSQNNYSLINESFSFKKKATVIGKFTLYEKEKEIILYKFEIE